MSRVIRHHGSEIQQVINSLWDVSEQIKRANEAVNEAAGFECGECTSLGGLFAFSRHEQCGTAALWVRAELGDS